MKIIKVSAIFKTTNAGDGKLIIEFQGPNGSTGLDWRFKNRCHFLPSMGLQLEAFRFSCVQNNRDSSVAYVTCIYCSLSVKISQGSKLTLASSHLASEFHQTVSAISHHTHFSATRTLALKIYESHKNSANKVKCQPKIILQSKAEI